MAKNKIPECIGIIMDGNRRWAKEKGLPTLQGHKKGYEILRDCLKWAKEKGIKNVVVYAFSTENWKRTEKEVGYLMNLTRKALSDNLESLKEEEARVRFIGRLEMLPEDIQEKIKELEEETKDRKDITLTIAFSYGGRSEILDAVNKAIEAGEEVSEENFSNMLWTKDIPDPDIIIRVGGEKRLSNFLPWQSVYSELFFTDTYWPDFSREEFEEILNNYGNRERRKGGD